MAGNRHQCTNAVIFGVTPTCGGVGDAAASAAHHLWRQEGCLAHRLRPGFREAPVIAGLHRKCSRQKPGEEKYNIGGLGTRNLKSSDAGSSHVIRACPVFDAIAEQGQEEHSLVCFKALAGARHGNLHRTQHVWPPSAEQSRFRHCAGDGRAWRSRRR